MLVVHAGAVGAADGELPTVPLLFGTLVWGGAWVIGDRVRQRRERIAELEERARRAEREAEREQRLAAAEERTRIARDLHDSAGHAINVILVQAGAARLLGAQDPERARAALETIEEVARETLGEIDQLVGALREDDRPERSAVEPPLGLAAVETLAERHRSAGLAVTFALADRAGRFHPASTRRRTGSSRRRSPTPRGTERGAPRSRSASDRMPSSSRSGTRLATGDAHAEPGMGSSACASVRHCSEAASTRARATAASASERACPTARSAHEPQEPCACSSSTTTTSCVPA